MRYLILILLMLPLASNAQFMVGEAGIVYNACTAPASITGTLSVCSGATTQLSNATAGGTWSSSSTAIATVGTAGLVTGVSAGTATISYNKSGCYAVATFTVNAQPVAITGTQTVSVGATTQLTNTTGGGVWSSVTTTVATIGTAGLVTGVAAGTTTISYVRGGCYATATVTVSVAFAVLSPTNKPSHVSITGGLTTANTGGSFGIGYSATGYSSGSHYFEATLNQMASGQESIGFTNYAPAAGNTSFFGQSAGSVAYRGGAWGISIDFTGTFVQQGSGTTIANGVVLSCVFDGTGHIMQFYYNGTQQGGNVTGVPAGTWYPGYTGSYVGGDGVTFNFGQNPWSATTATLRTTLAGAGVTIGW